MQLGDKVESPWGRHLIPQIDANMVIDLAFMSGRVQRDQAYHVRQEVLKGFPAQGFHIFCNSAQKLFDLSFGYIVEH